MADFFSELIPILVVFALGSIALRRSRQDDLDGMLGDVGGRPGSSLSECGPDATDQ